MHTTHSSNLGKYVLVFIALGVLTAIEVIVAVVIHAAGALPLLLALAVAKAILVALFFMHLKDDTKWFSFIFIFPLLLASLLIYWVVFPGSG
ncbi:MAG TPA: cytochrome C oxidase subunit IV family protein [Anaerolineae bacterium]|nr:cytochrome C oxidase subunit IV family protein [Anaerolineae bacterium]